jgi:dephospho-CoA kinase
MRVAITGGIAEGKSTVLGYLSDAGFAVESSDRLAAEIFRSGPVQAGVATLLGIAPPVPPEALRTALGDDSVRRGVNALTHPLILEAIDSSPATFFEVPLLVEACLQGLFERVWVVTCGPQEQLRRLAARLGSEAAATALIRTQLTSRAKLPFADRLIRTNQDGFAVMRSVTLAAQQELR